MRWLMSMFASLTTALILSTPALAQGAGPETAADSQYDDGVSASEFSTADIPKTFAGNAAHGANAVNDALVGTDAAPEDGAESSGEPAAPGGGATAADSVAGLTVLPETGGASVVGSCAGLLLLGAGLMLFRRTGR